MSVEKRLTFKTEACLQKLEFQELDDVPLYYEAGQMMNICKSPMPKLINVRSAILNAGFRVSFIFLNTKINFKYYFA